MGSILTSFIIIYNQHAVFHLEAINIPFVIIMCNILKKHYDTLMNLFQNQGVSFFWHKAKERPCESIVPVTAYNFEFIVSSGYMPCD